MRRAKTSQAGVSSTIDAYIKHQPQPNLTYSTRLTRYLTPVVWTSYLLWRLVVCGGWLIEL